MKIGIRTFHRAHNYGAVLQAYALQKHINSLNHEVDIIDYRPEAIDRAHDLFNSKRFQGSSSKGKLWHISQFMLLSRKKIKRHSNFNRFIKSLKHSKNIYKGNSAMIEGYDCYFFGSDQIWNPSIFSGLDPIYTGQFDKRNSQFVSYAASAGMVSYLENHKEELKNRLNNFDSIAVRETNLQEFIQKLTSKKVHVVLDPVLLLDAKEWNEIAIPPPSKKPYILLYQVKRDKNANKIAEKLAAENNWDLIELTCEAMFTNKRYTNQTASPSEFVGYFKHANFIITTSFHGTAFSIIFNRPFYSIMFNSPNDERSKSLLEILKLESRAISLTENKHFSNVEFSDANKLLEEYRIKSAEYIKNSLKNTTGPNS